MSKFILFKDGILLARYDSEIHGEREVTIIDPNWIRPVHDVTVQPGESFPYNGESVLNDTDKTQIIRDVPDLSVDPEYITIKNPACKIPAEAIKVSDELFYRTINEQDGIWSFVDGAVVKLPFPAPTLAELKQSQLTEINAEFNKAMQTITAGIPDIERESWKKQEDEARAYIANNSSITPLIDALALSRSVDKAELVTRIIAKADLFAGISGAMIGRRQGLEDAINALPETATPEDIAAIVW